MSEETKSGVDKPNVLVVLTDQQRWDTLGVYGNPMDLTPNADEMARQGTRLNHAISTQPLCAPTRACLQTGQYATEHGVWKNDIVPRAEDWLASQFSDHGYQVGYIGKWHIGDTGTDPVPPERRGGYEDYWLAGDIFEFMSHPYEGYLYDGDGDQVDFTGYRVDALTDFALSFLQNERDDPFFLFLSYLEPHHQNDMDTYVAPDGYAEQYDNVYVPPDLEGHPGGTRLNWYEELPNYYGICERIDENLGHLLGELDHQGIADDTIVLFTSDHGCHFGTRHLGNKNSCHDASVRVPAILRGPHFDGGETVNEVTSLLDIPPTLLDAAGIDPPESFSGQSFLPLVDGTPSDDWSNEAFIQTSVTEVGRAIRTKRWKYSVYAPDRDPMENESSEEYVERYLYDLHADPYERVNLVGRGDYRDVADELRQRLLERIESVEGSTPAIEKASYTV